MALPPRNNWESNTSFQRSFTLPNCHNFHRLQAASSEDLIQMTENCGGLSAVGIPNEVPVSTEQHSLFATANNFVSAVTAMDKHVMIPNRLRDHRLPLSGTSHLASSNIEQPHVRSRHGSGQSMGAGSVAGGLSLASDISEQADSGASMAAMSEELVDTDMYSCYRLLNRIKKDLLLTRSDEIEGQQSDYDSEGSDSDREFSDRSVTPKEELVIMSMQGTEDAAIRHGSDSAEGTHRQPSGSVSLPLASTQAVRQRFRLHLRGLMTILTQLTETANVMTNYYDRCLIPGVTGTTTALSGPSPGTSSITPSNTCNTISPPAYHGGPGGSNSQANNSLPF